jgi:hypothetical protein
MDNIQLAEFIRSLDSELVYRKGSSLSKLWFNPPDYVILPLFSKTMNQQGSIFFFVFQESITSKIWELSTT